MSALTKNFYRLRVWFNAVEYKDFLYPTYGEAIASYQEGIEAGVFIQELYDWNGNQLEEFSIFDEKRTI